MVASKPCFAASSQLSAHENPRQNGIWTVDTTGDYSLPEAQWKVHHQDLPNEGKDDNTWRAGYKWAITKAAVDDSGWGPCYPACGESVQFREVLCAAPFAVGAAGAATASLLAALASPL